MRCRCFQIGPRAAALAAMASKIQLEKERKSAAAAAAATSHSSGDATAEGGGGSAFDSMSPKDATAKTVSEKQLALGSLLQVEMFAHLPEATLLKIVDALEQRSFHTGGTIIKKGTIGTAFYMIKRGTVGFSVDDTGVKLVGTRGAGESFGEIALKSNSATTTASAIAQDPVACYVLSKQAFDYVMEEEVVVHLAATKIQSSYRGRLYRRKNQAKIQHAKDKKAAQRLRMARLGIKASEMPNHHEIVDACGARPFSLSSPLLSSPFLSF
eukprot:COSAG05_NODE_4756_length_1384_cov_1.126848_2_plen_268_part_01